MYEQLPPMPNMGDGLVPYLYLPSKATLYGYRNGTLNTWIRVVQDGTGGFTTSIDSPDGNSVDLIDTIEVSQFLKQISFGNSVLVEVATCGLKMGIDLTQFNRQILNQAVLRNYEARAATLLEIAKRKKGSIVKSPSIPTLTAKLDGVIINWRQFMNTGRIGANLCLQREHDGRPIPYSGIPIRQFEQDIEELRTRMYYMNFKNCQYKMSQRDRTNMLRSFGLE